MHHPIRRLAVWFSERAIIEGERANDSDHETLRRLGIALLSADPAARNPSLPGAATPALEWLPLAIESATTPSVTARAFPLRETVGYATWRPPHAASSWSASFRDNTAFGELIGPTGPVMDDSVRFGFALFGPSTRYCEHAHGAAEIYFVLSSHLDCIVGHAKNAFRVNNGDFAVIGPHQRHELRSGPAPTLTLWAWLDDVHAATYRREGGAWRQGQQVSVD
ncbi:MAG: dimethylsulfonioproprionate lyase family protein [Pseudomonadota bacterium]